MRRDDDDANSVGLCEWGTLHLDRNHKPICKLETSLRSNAMGQVLVVPYGNHVSR